ncbi:hypothetical protein ACFUJX_11390 [Streptomyces rubiginosohelvolus]|uniref:hypothetical protein n=1 Tax=Streptomyces rubiginosohelvolus TaxID=67362 RepID=UPI00363061D1
MPLPLLASALIALFTLGYAGVCAAWPWKSCRHCEGLGFTLTYTKKGKPKRGKHCRKCDGHGIRIRAGRHIYNLWVRTARRGRATDEAAARASISRGKAPAA